MHTLPAKLRFGPFTANQAALQGLTFYELGKLVSSGIVEQLGRGIYRASGGDIDEEEQFRIATLRVSTPAAICLLSALAHYHLTDLIPRKTWIMVPSHKRSTDSSLKLFRARNPQWKVGVKKENGYSITTVERTLVDCLTHRTHLGSQAGIAGLRKAMESKLTTLSQVMDTAKALHVVHRILPYIEALS